MRLFGRFTAGVLLTTLSVGGGIGVAALDQAPAGAVTAITVNDASDTTVPSGNCTLSPEGDCTLRAAAIAAGDAGDSTITLPDANTVPNNPSSTHVYTLLNSKGEIDFDNGHTITLTGAGAALSIVEMTPAGSVTNRVFEVDSGTLDVSGITVEGGNIDGDGGAFYTDGGMLNLSNSTVTDNTAQAGGGVYLSSGGTLTDDTIDSNTAIADTAGIYIEHGTTTISGGSVSDNISEGDTGGIYIENDNSGDTTTVTGVTIDSNTATFDTGGVYVENDASTPTTVTFTSDTIDSNTSATDTGGLYVENDGDGSVFTMANTDVSKNAANGTDTGGVYVENDGTSVTTTFTSDTIDENTATSDAGGMYLENDGTDSTFTMTGGSLDGNTASPESASGYAGGVYIENDGHPSTATFTGTDISHNLAYEGGGVYVEAGHNTLNQVNISQNDATEAGAGMAFDTAQSGATSVTASTISGNTVGGLVGISAVLGDGGGILSRSCNAITLTNDTITGNRSTNGGGYFGSACAESPTVSTAFTFDTVAGNTATDGSTGAGNVQTIDDSTLTFGQTIIAGGTATGGTNTNCSFTGPGSVTSKGYNLIDNTNNCGTAAATDIIGKDPQLGALTNNGGPTETLLPADSAPEVGSIPDAACVATGIGTDQRGIARGAGANSSCTIGAVEVGQNFNGYRLVANEGGIFDFGLLFSGSLANNHLNAPIVGLANAPGPAAYLMAGGDGGVFALGGANFFGSLGGQAIPSPIAAIAAPPTENGYWLAAQNGKIYNFGAVPALPAIQMPLGGHIVGMASTTDGQGAWLTDQFGDVYAEGDAQYVGGLGGVHINAPIVGIAAAASGQGYVLAAADGGAFNYGTQGFFGSVPGSLKPGQQLNAPVVGIAVTHSGKGYWFVGADGGVFNYGDAPFLGSMAGVRLNGPVVGIQHLGSVAVPG